MAEGIARNGHFLDGGRNLLIGAVFDQQPAGAHLGGVLHGSRNGRVLGNGLEGRDRTGIVALLRLDGRGAHARQDRVSAVAFLLQLVESGERLVSLVLVGKLHRREELVAGAGGTGIVPIFVGDLADGSEHDENGNGNDIAAKPAHRALHLVGTQFLIDFTNEAIVVECHSRLRPRIPIYNAKRTLSGLLLHFAAVVRGISQNRHEASIGSGATPISHS